MKSKVRFRKIAFVRGHKNDQNRKLTLTFSPQRQTPALHVADVPATAGKLAKSCAVMHGSWFNFRSKSPSPRKRPLLKFSSHSRPSDSAPRRSTTEPQRFHGWARSILWRRHITSVFWIFNEVLLGYRIWSERKNKKDHNFYCRIKSFRD